MKYLKQSTAAVIPFGPALLPADGVTLVTSLVSALDHASTGIFLCKNGSAAAIRHATVTATTYDAYGSYLVTLDTTDTGTLGRLRVMFAAAASCLPIWEDFTVLPANVFDSLVSGSDNLQVDATQFAGQTITAAAGVTLPTSVASPTNITAGTITTVTNLTNAPTSGDLTATMKTSVTTAVPTANANADAILDRTDGVESSWTLRQALRIILSAVAGKLSGAAGTTINIRDMADTKNRISATVDGDGNRSAVTRDAS